MAAHVIYIDVTGALRLSFEQLSLRMTNNRRHLSWSEEDLELVQTNLRIEGRQIRVLIAKLVEKSGNPRWACRRLLRRMGVRSKPPQRPWTVGEQQRLVKFIDLYSIPEIARLMRRSISSIWHMLYRLGANAKMGKDHFTKYTLATALHVRPEVVESWIRRGWLKAGELSFGQSRRTIIAAEDFCQFCREHTKDVVGNRLSKERLDFVYRFAFPPSHADLLPVRDSKKERTAYEEQELQNRKKLPQRLGAKEIDQQTNPEEETA